VIGQPHKRARLAGFCFFTRRKIGRNGNSKIDKTAKKRETKVYYDRVGTIRAEDKNSRGNIIFKVCKNCLNSAIAGFFVISKNNFFWNADKIR